MKTIKVIRFERDGKGLFRHRDETIYDNSIADRTYRRHQNGDFPTPWNDKLIDKSSGEEYLDLDKNSRNWFCAYKTIEQVQAWILTDEIEFFVSIGFRILMLEVEEYQEGERQTIYTRESIVNIEDITSLFI